MSKIKISEIVQTCEACPSQWEGTLEDGRAIYIRYRWGGLSVRLSETPTDEIMDAVKGEEIFGEDIGEPLDGTIELTRVYEILQEKGII